MDQRMEHKVKPTSSLMMNQLQMCFVLGRLPIKYQVLYNDLTGNFPFMSIDGSVCYFVMYHYKTNAILVKAIKNLDDHSIYEAYKDYLKHWKRKSINPK